MQITRRGALSAGAGALAMPALPKYARAAEFVWRLGHTAPASFPLHIRLLEAAATIARESGGRIELNVVGDSQLGNQMGLLGQVRSGALEMTPVTGQALSSAIAIAALPLTGFAFTGYDALWPAMDGALGKLVRDQIASRVGMVAMERCLDFGFRQITSSAKPVRVAADLEGQRIRIAGETDLVMLFRAFKAVPLSLPLGSLVQALRERIVDAQEGPLPLIVAARLFEAQSDCALTNHVWDGQWLCMNANTWNRLPDRFKPIVADALNAAALAQREDSAQMEFAMVDFLSAQGMIVATIDQLSFRDRLRSAGYYKELRARFGEEPWAVLEKFTGRLA